MTSVDLLKMKRINYTGCKFSNSLNKLCGRPPQYAPALLTFDLLILKVVSDSHLTWATSVPILVFLGLSVLDLGPMCATDVRQTDVRHASSLNASALWRRGHNNEQQKQYELNFCPVIM